MSTFEKTTTYPVSASSLYNWHARPGAFARLVPPWDNIDVIEATGGITDGARRIMKIKKGPVAITWEALHRDHIEGRQFVDEQVRGPFASWVHTHRFEDVDDNHSRLLDHVEYSLPLGPVGSFFGGGEARKTLEQMFAFRHRRTGDDLRRHAETDRRLKVAVTGSSGLIGTALCAFLSTGGHDVLRVVRSRDQADAGDGSVYWSPAEGVIDTEGLEGVDAVVHLAGENVASRRWSKTQQRRIMDSRVDGTALLADAIGDLDEPPEVFICASAVGFYGDRGDEILDEESEPGSIFLSDVCTKWENACQPAQEADIRTVNARIGVVLSPNGGALSRMLPAVKFGLAGRLGSGDQFTSWVDLDDVVGALHFLMLRDDLDGPFNLTAPEPVTNRQLLAAIGDVLNRPTAMPIPKRLIETVMGKDVAGETALVSQRAIPRRLQEEKFSFFYGDLNESLSMKLGASH